MECDALAQRERVRPAIVGDLPGFGQGGLRHELGIDLDQPFVDQPDDDPGGGEHGQVRIELGGVTLDPHPEHAPGDGDRRGILACCGGRSGGSKEGYGDQRAAKG